MNLFTAPDLHFHPDMPPAELVGRWLYLLEKTNKPNWPLDVLPLLRVRYGGLLKASLLAVTIYEDNAAMGEFELQTADMTEGVMPAVRFSSEHFDMHPVIAGLFERCDDMDFAQASGLFDEHALSIMARLVRGQTDDNEIEKQRNAANHYLRCARLLASHIVDTTDLGAAAIAALESGGAREVLAEDERGMESLDFDESTIHSMLSERWRDAVSSAVDEAFYTQQPFAVQLAFWLTDDSTAGDVEEHCQFSTPPGADEDFGLRDLSDMGAITNGVAEYVLDVLESPAQQREAAKRDCWNED